VLQSKEECEKSISYGWICGLVSMISTLVVVLSGFVIESDDAAFRVIADPIFLIDVLLLGVLAYYIRQKSRVAATLMVMYFALIQWFVWSESGSTSSFGVAAIFLYFYLMAMNATFTWHSAYNDEEAPVLNSIEFQS